VDELGDLEQLGAGALQALDTLEVATGTDNNTANGADNNTATNTAINNNTPNNNTPNNNTANNTLGGEGGNNLLNNSAEASTSDDLSGWNDLGQHDLDTFDSDRGSPGRN
jgi:hypothetical protein